MQSLLGSLATVDPLTFGLGLACLAVILLWPKGSSPQATMVGRVVSRLPGTLIAIAGSTLVVALLSLPVETVGSAFGAIPRGLPAPRLPDFNWSTVNFCLRPSSPFPFLGPLNLCCVLVWPMA